MFFRLHIASELRSDCNICRVGLSPGFPGRCLVLEVVGAPGALGVQFQCQLHPLCPDADIWKLCRFLGSMMRAVKRLPGGWGRFIPGELVPSMVGCGTLAGKSAAMG